MFMMVTLLLHAKAQKMRVVNQEALHESTQSYKAILTLS